MHIVTVDNFLVCCSLETGGYVLGYLGAIFTLLGIVSLVGITVLVTVSLETIEEMQIEVDANTEWILTLLRDSQISE
jgi:hypothetical protein